MAPQLPCSCATEPEPVDRLAGGWNNGVVNKSEKSSFYDAVGGHDTFVRLVATFYSEVAADPLLRPMYPDEDLSEPAARLTMFLEQYWGGPTTYSEQRGHPRLGMRHAPFAVTPEARDRWLSHMRTAVNASDLSAEHAATFWEYVDRAAHFLVNTPDDEPGHPTLDVHSVAAVAPVQPPGSATTP